MKKRLYSIMYALVAGTLMVSAQNTLVLPDTVVAPGKTLDLPIMMQNADDVVAVQFNLDIPKGMVLNGSNLQLTERKDDHQVMVKKMADNKYTVIVYSPTNKKFTGNSGNLLTANITLDKELTDGTQLNLGVSNVVLGALNGANICTGSQGSQVTAANKYKYIFQSDGNVLKSDSILFGSPIVAPENPTKIGYTFTGWSPAYNANATVPTGGVTYDAQWQINQYTISFDAAGGSEVASITQDYATAVTAPADPTKTGYTFKGWDKEVPATIPAEDVTLTAQWQINQYTISFDAAGGSEVASITQDYATTVTAPADPTKTGYTFKGWDKEVPTTIPAEDVTLTAQWQINKYAITYKVDGEVYQEDSVVYASAVKLIDNPAKTGYTFSGWSEVPETMPAEGITVTGSFTINQYTISFDAAGGSEVASITQDYATSVTAPENPTKTGYTFMGWNKEVPATIPAENITLTAQWQINQYTISFDAAGGSEVASITQDYATAVTAPADPTKTGYTFKGWDKEVPTTIPAEDVKLTAQWQINQYTISFDVDGGSEVASITQDYATAVTAPAAPTKTGYTFKGWDKEVPATIPAEDVTLTAQWQINKYAITYKVDGEVYQEDSVVYASAVKLIDNPTKTGYTFSGWSEAPETMPAEGIIVTGSFTINQYTISFDAAGGSEVASITQDYATSVTAPENPTKTGYTFKGWDKEVPATIPAEDVTLTAQWQINQYTISFDVDGGSEVASITQDYATSVTAPENPTKTGYTFVGWDKEVPATIPAEDVKLTAQWQINQYQLTFKDVEGNVICDTLVTYNEAIVAPVAPEVYGYTFLGWDKDVPTKMPAEDFVAVATYQVNTYSVTYMYNGEVLRTDSVAFGDEIPAFTYAPEDTERYQYAFVEWQDEQGNAVELTTLTTATDVVVYAKVNITDGIRQINTRVDAAVYNLNGAKANGNSRIYIKNGKKYVK